MRENRNIVASFERFDDSNPFEPIKLRGHPDDFYSESMHGQLAAIIHYKAPYFDNDGSPIRISFGLENDMTVNTILGMPVIKDLGMIPNCCARSIICEDSATSAATYNMSLFISRNLLWLPFQQRKCCYLFCSACREHVSSYPPFRPLTPRALC